MNNKLQCGECTACCTAYEIPELNKPAFTPCIHLTKSGCGIYDSRPETCRRFKCSWLNGKLGNDITFRPDKLGLVTSGHEDIVIGPYAQVIEVWDGAVNQPDTLRWFCRQTRAAECGEIQPILLTRKVGKLLYAQPEVLTRLTGESIGETSSTTECACPSSNRVRQRQQLIADKTRWAHKPATTGKVNG